MSCKGITGSGTPCSRKPKADLEYCFQHFKSESDLDKNITMDESEFILKKVDTIMYYETSLDKPSSVAFDLDHTLIKPRGSIFPKRYDDLMWTYTQIPKLLAEISKQNNIIIFSNQSKFTPIFNLRVLCIIDLLKSVNKNISFAIYLSIADKKNPDRNRKPGIGMYEYYSKQHSQKIAYYVGDAAGRKDDHSFDDLHFAINAKIPFKTVESFCGLPSNKSKETIYDTFRLNIKTNEDQLNTIPENSIVFLLGFNCLIRENIIQKIILQKPKNIIVCETTVIFNSEIDKYTGSKYCVIIDMDINIAKHLNLYEFHILNKKYIPDSSLTNYVKTFSHPDNIKYIIHINPYIDPTYFEYRFLN
jgi:DNA 3'-phosphatase